ncbi:MAG: polyprenyl synthetase family protein [Chloracidobacterium sp.]|nr:polyprenyl synthetase family protein [Chloracidobacterium sp.]MCC6824154.1 polyprenyl synthetase family protein [Acidobacteriota bacterium]MCO5333860.1 polyprenyl synthetase family protein [Pyrinomonadaceae bacterium]
MNDLETFLKHVIEATDDALGRLLPGETVEPVRLHKAIRWSVFAGGKRFRPVMTFAVGAAFGADEKHLVRTAAAVEMIHTFSLIHDDLPSMDDDDLRRGKPTCHKKFDEATAILAGDALQSMAFGVIADDEYLEPEMKLRLIANLAAASSSPRGMVAGQQLDLDAEGVDPRTVDIEHIHRLKTGALIEFAGDAGAIIGRASAGESAAIHEYSSQIGLLFQITDDLLDIRQSSEVLGKTAGKDVTAKKATFPGHYGIKEADRLASEVHDRAIAALDHLGSGRGLLTALCDHVFRRIN